MGEGNKQPELRALCSLAIALPTIAVLLRLWGNHLRKDRRFGWDDFFAAATLPWIWAENGIIIWWISLGLGTHAATVPPPDLAQSSKIIFVAAFLYDACIVLPKFSALFFYHRIFEKTNKWFNAALWVVGVLNAGWLISAWFSTLFQCSPVRKSWQPEVEGHCFPQWNWFLGTALASMIIDVFILVMPLPLLWRLRMSTTRKLFVMGVFVCGYGVVVVSIGRLVSLANAGSALLDDVTWGTITYIAWVQCEGPVSVICVCLPAMFHLFKGALRNGPTYLVTGQEKPSSSSQFYGTGRTDSQTDGAPFMMMSKGSGTNTQAYSSRDSDSMMKERDESPISLRDDRIYVRSQVNVETV